MADADNSFVFYNTFYQEQKRLEKQLGKETAYDFINAIIEYGLNGASPDEDNILWVYGLDQAFFAIDGAKARYTKAIENGKKGGAKIKYSKEEIWKYKQEGLKKVSYNDEYVNDYVRTYAVIR